AEPLILAFGRNILRDFSGLPDSLLDVIPADFVVNTVLAVAANPPPDAKPRVYHAASGSRNPLRFRRIVDEARTYFTEHPLRDRYGQAIGTPSWTYPTRQEMATRARTALRVVEAAQWFVERLPLGASIAEVSDDLNAEASSVRSAIERRAGRGDVLAVFDVDGTLVETNVVEYFLWMRLRAQPLEEWPAFMVDILRKGPRWLYLERRSRAEFQRSFY